MKHLTQLMHIILVTLGLLMSSQSTHAQFAAPNSSIIERYQSLYHGQQNLIGSIPQNQIAQPGSVIDQYQNLYHGRSAGAGLIATPAPLEIAPLPTANYPACSQFASPELIAPQVISAPAYNNFASPGPVYFQPHVQQSASGDLLDTRNYSLLDYRRLFQTGRTPEAHEMVGYWRGVNKGIVELVGYRQFIKEILPDNNGVIRGDNIKVGQINQDMLRCLGWQPVPDPQTGEFARQGKFAIQPPRGIGAFKHGATFNYRDGGNGRTDPANLLVDKVVMLDANHMLGRATANFGPLQIPLAYFVLERIQ